MAQAGDAEFADDTDEKGSDHRRGSWNRFTAVANEPNTGQLNGQWYAHLLGYILPPAGEASAVRQCLILTAQPPSMEWSTQWPGRERGHDQLTLRKRGPGETYALPRWRSMRAC